MRLFIRYFGLFVWIVCCSAFFTSVNATDRNTQVESALIVIGIISFIVFLASFITSRKGSDNVVNINSNKRLEPLVDYINKLKFKTSWDVISNTLKGKWSEKDIIEAGQMSYNPTTISENDYNSAFSSQIASESSVKKKKLIPTPVFVTALVILATYFGYLYKQSEITTPTQPGPVTTESVNTNSTIQTPNSQTQNIVPTVMGGKTHTACKEKMCATVDGDGVNECTQDSECYHTECINLQCNYVFTKGVNQCKTTADCDPDPIISCTFPKECNSVSISMKKSKCDAAICCNIGDIWEPLSKQQCDQMQLQHAQDYSDLLHKQQLDRQQDCQRKMTEYTQCEAELTKKTIEYTECVSKNQQATLDYLECQSNPYRTYCSKPYPVTCFKPVQSCYKPICSY